MKLNKDEKFSIPKYGNTQLDVEEWFARMFFKFNGQLSVSKKINNAMHKLMQTQSTDLLKTIAGDYSSLTAGEKEEYNETLKHIERVFVKGEKITSYETKYQDQQNR